MKKVGIITMYHNSENYGCIAQSFALCKYIESLGFDAQLISYQHRRIKNKNEEISRYGILHYIGEHSNNFFLKINYRINHKVANLLLKKKLSDDLSKRSLAFEKSRNLSSHSELYSDDTIYQISSKYDIFVSGSDQIWKPGIANDAYLYNFLPEGSKVISYASSTAVVEFSKEYDEFMKNSLAKYHWISVREKNAQIHFQKLLDREVDLVVDPTLLMSVPFWNDTAENYVSKEPYLFAYLLGESKRQRKIIEKIAKEKGLKIITLPHLGGTLKLTDRNFGDIQLYDIDFYQFLGLIKNASLVMTDSFHAVVFSNVFCREFLVFDREVLNSKDSMRGRLDTLLGLFGEKERQIEDFGSCMKALNEKIDYEKVHSILNDIAEESRRKIKGIMFE